MFDRSFLRYFALVSISVVTIGAIVLPGCATAQERTESHITRIFSEVPFREVLIVPEKPPGHSLSRSVHPTSDDPMSDFVLLTTDVPDKESRIFPTGAVPIDFVLAAVRVTKRDGTVVLFSPPIQSRAQVSDLLFGTSFSLRTIIEQGSWGQSAILDGSLNGASIPDNSFETIEVDLSDGADPTEAFCFSPPRQKGEARGLYTFISREARDFFNCPWDASTNTISGGVFVAMATGGVSQAYRDTLVRVIAHEHGHLLGLKHSHGNALDRPDLGKAAIEYGDTNCLMGVGLVSALDRVNAVQSYRLGWIHREDITVLSRPGTYKVQITGADSGPGTSLPSSVWIYREPEATDNAVPGLFVVSSSVQSEIITRISRGENGSTVDSIPEGLIVHSVPFSDDFALPSPHIKNRPYDSGSFAEGTVALGGSLTIPTAGITVRLLARLGNTSTIEIEVKDLAGVFARLGLTTVPTLGDILRKTLLINDNILTEKDVRVLVALNRSIKRTSRILRTVQPFSARHFRDGLRILELLRHIQSHAGRARHNGTHTQLSIRRLKSDVTRYLQTAKL